MPNTLKQAVEEEIEKLILSLQYTIDNDGKIHEESMGNQLRQSLLSIARQSMDAVEQSKRKEWEK
jgi:ferric iron reductase protein FhuF